MQEGGGKLEQESSGQEEQVGESLKPLLQLAYEPPTCPHKAEWGGYMGPATQMHSVLLLKQESGVADFCVLVVH